uniref:Uncharacterized protein n=1 Tax=Rangifer tarandus platyrhynchus TaxID=3082113 RepID=A0ACB0EDT5_RANTA|nr:unnamed protein product [Rangifer tarandus platyrhynchus]
MRHSGLSTYPPPASAPLPTRAVQGNLLPHWPKPPHQHLAATFHAARNKSQERFQHLSQGEGACTLPSPGTPGCGGQRTGPAEQRGSVEQPRAEGSAGEGTLREKGTPHSVGRPARKCSGIESLLKAAEASGRGAKRRTGPPGGRPPQPPSRAHGSPLSLPEPQASPLVEEHFGICPLLQEPLLDPSPPWDVERRRSADTGRKAERPQEEPPCPRQSWGFSPQDWERPHFCCSRRSGELTQSRCLNPNIRGEEEPRVSRGPGRRLSTCEPAPHAGRHPLRGEASPERALRSPAGACLATPKPQGEDGGGRAAPGRVLEKRERGGTRVLCPAAEKGRVWGREGACISPGAGEACEEVGRGTAETQALGVSSRKRRCLCVKTGASLHPTESKHG